MRKLGNILLDLEPLITEMVEEHELQFGDILSLIHSHLVVHNPEAKEEYEEGGYPIFYYGPNRE